MAEGVVKKNKDTKELIVITGCDSGIGKSLAENLNQMGHSLIISYIHENHFKKCENVFAKKMDLTNQDDIHDFNRLLKELAQKGYRINTVIINAGVALGGPIENIPMDIYRKSFEINYFGAISIIKGSIPQIINNKGRIMIIGSMAGRIAMPFLPPYASTKFALERFTDSLRREMNPFGVKTILIEPAAVATPIWNKAKEQEISYVEEKYLNSLYSFRDNFIEGGNNGMDVDLAAKQIIKILFMRNPRARYIIAKNRLTSKLMTWAPSRMIDKAVAKMFKMYYGNNISNLHS